MRTRRAGVVIVDLGWMAAYLVLLAGGDLPAQQAPNGGTQTRMSLEVDVQRKVAFDYLLFLPKGYDPEGEKQWPLILFLHGAGERGNDPDRVAIHGPPKIVKGNPDFPFVVVSPQCPSRSWWDPDDVVVVLDEALKRYRVDPARVYLTGLSMGGYGTWATGLRYPDRFAAIAPICGGGATPDVLVGLYRDRSALRSLPVWAFHGAKDDRVPLEESKRMVDALKRAGNENVELTVYPEAHHDSWSKAYDDERLYEWFLSHSR